MTGQLAQMNLHVRRKLSELFLRCVQGSRERDRCGDGDGDVEEWLEREKETRRERIACINKLKRTETKCLGSE